jgi:hypothetical protein
MANITVYSEKGSNRLRYILDWLLEEQMGCTYTLVHDEKALPHNGFFISYGKHFINALSIPDKSLLWEQGIKEHSIDTGSWYELPTFYAVKEEDFTLPFDIFSALFFLLSRYEEYYSFPPDKYGRYPAQSSVLFKNNLLRQPVVDAWLHQFALLLKQQYGVDVKDNKFSYQPTYDIDIAYSYRNKGLVRTLGAYLKNALKGNTEMIAERSAVLRGAQKDPYDSFDLLKSLHSDCGMKPVYFILSALRTSAYDKNIHPNNPDMHALIQGFAKEGSVGIHPSYYSYVGENMHREKQVLEKIILQDIHLSRQHYIKIKTPDTYRLLLHNGISDDYSMGYGTHLGFRAGTGRSFYWYDIEKDAATELRIHPFCFMDSTALFEEKLSADEAFELLRKMTLRLGKYNSQLITVFHNFSLGTAKEWNGWSERYAAFLKEMSR